MKKSAGLTREQLLKFARENTPKFVAVDVEEREDFFVLVLEWESKIGLRSAIHKISYADSVKDAEEKRLLNRLKSETEKELLEKIQQFGEARSDEIIDSFGLTDKYKKKYEDKNVIYKVKKWHKTNEHITTNLEAYYNEKAKEIVPFSQEIWELFIKELVKHRHSKEIVDFLHGANERLKQLIFAKDVIRDILQMRPSGNDTWFLVNFHVFHFISLAKSLGDNLAWLVRLHCNVNIDEKKTDLTMKAFENKLKTANKKLYDRIYGHVDFAQFRRFKEFRDIVHHRHALHVEQIKLGFEGPETVMIPIDPKSGLIIDGRRFMESKYPKLAEASDKDSIIKCMHACMPPNLDGFSVVASDYQRVEDVNDSVIV